MTIIEILLSFAIVVLAAQLFILQRHYGEKLSAQSVVLNYLIDVVAAKKVDPKSLRKIKQQVFDSSQ
ncbi:MAG: hypothetical protein ABFC84_12905 [Veillonellales bacterium]